MADHAKNVLIGLFVVAAFGVIAFMLLFLHPTVGDDGRVLKIRFSDIDKVSVGTRVTYGGKPVGEVTKIVEIENLKNPRQTRNGYVYLYELTAVVDSSVEVFNTDMIALRTSGLLGEKSVSITPMPPKPGQELVENQGEVIYGNESGSVEETLKEFKELADKFEEALDSVLKTFDTVNNTNLVDKIATTAQNLSEITTSFSEQRIVDKVAQVAQNVSEITDTFNNKEKWGQIIGNIDIFSGDLARGEGTLGSIIKKDDLYLRTNSIISKAETIMDDINHYGLMFSSDKNWQRVRARRANLLYSLRSPQEFQNFFNDEINQIYTSLARVNMVLEETDSNCESLGDNPQYVKVFADLLRRVKQMEDSIQLYNQQLMEDVTFQTELCQ